MSNLPHIPTAFYRPAPRPPEPSDLAGLPTRQEQRRRDDWATYLRGPESAVLDDGSALILFPAFGWDATQAGLLRAAGYAKDRCWVKHLAGQAEIAGELDWARRAYAALHPGWAPQCKAEPQPAGEVAHA